MKRIQLFATAFLLMSAQGLAFADAPSAPSDSKPSSPEKPKPKSGSVIPILMRKDNSLKGLKSPGINLYGSVEVNDGSLTFKLPFDIYPLTCELEQLTSPYGYWTSTFDDAESCEMYFDGTSGDYKLTLSDGETTYTGYFSL